MPIPTSCHYAVLLRTLLGNVNKWPHSQALSVFYFSVSSREAESFKEQGNAYYIKKDYSEAFNYYTKAIGKNSQGYQLQRISSL